MSWIVVSDVAYALIEAEAKRAGLTVDALVERTFAQAHVLPPIDGKPFKVYRASDLDKLSPGAPS